MTRSWSRRYSSEETTDGGLHLAWKPFPPEAVCRTAVGSPLNGRVEVAGPEQYRMDQFFRQALAARNDPREVVTDPNDTAGFARCCGPFSLPI